MVVRCEITFISLSLKIVMRSCWGRGAQQSVWSSRVEKGIMGHKGQSEEAGEGQLSQSS